MEKLRSVPTGIMVLLILVKRVSLNFWRRFSIARDSLMKREDGLQFLNLDNSRLNLYSWMKEMNTYCSINLT